MVHYYENLELRNAYERVKVLSEQLTTTLGIARELAEALQSRKCSCNGTGLQHKPGYTHYETDAGEECPAYHYGSCPKCELARAALANARAAGILNAPEGVGG